MVINAEEGIREYDKRIAGFAHEAGKGMIIVVNKWDTLEKRQPHYEKLGRRYP